MTYEDDILIANIEQDINNILDNMEDEEQAIEKLLELGLNIDDIYDRLTIFYDKNKNIVNR